MKRRFAYSSRNMDLERGGKKVVLIDMKTQEELCNDIFFLIRITMFELLEELDVITYYESSISSITEKGVEILDNSGNRKFLEADTVITSLGLRRNEMVINGLISVIPETYVVGDSNQIGSIATANRDAFNVAIEI